MNPGTYGFPDGIGPSPGPQSGDILYTSRKPAAGYLKCDGSVYQQSAYTALYASLGLITNGVNVWTKRTDPVAGALNVVCYGNGLYVAGGGSGVIITSPDGITWTSQANPFTASGAVYGVCFGNGQFVAVGWNGSAGIIATSPDGVTWTSRANPYATVYAAAVCFGGGLFVVIGNNGVIATSPDGITWTSRGSPVGSFGAAICYGNGLYVAGGSTATGSIATSTDGITWTPRNSPLNNIAFTLCYGNGLFIAGGGVTANGNNYGLVCTSTDGITWTPRLSPFSASQTFPQGSCFGNGLFVVSGKAGIIATSPDGITWTVPAQQFFSGAGPYVTGTSADTISAVCNGNNQFVAVAYNGTTGYIATAPAYTYSTTAQFSVPNVPAYNGVAAYIKT